MKVEDSRLAGELQKQAQERCLVMPAHWPLTSNNGVNAVDGRHRKKAGYMEFELREKSLPGMTSLRLVYDRNATRQSPQSCASRAGLAMFPTFHRALFIRSESTCGRVQSLMNREIGTGGVKTY